MPLLLDLQNYEFALFPNLQLLLDFSGDVDRVARTPLDGEDPASVDPDPGEDRRVPEVGVGIGAQRYLDKIDLMFHNINS